jgi:hypothetical protein
VLWEIGVDATPALVDAQDDALDVGATKALELHGEVLRRPEADDPEQKPVCGVSPANQLEVRALFVQFRGRYGVPRSPAQRERACRSPDARGGNQGKRSPEEGGFRSQTVLDQPFVEVTKAIGLKEAMQRGYSTVSSSEQADGLARVIRLF